MIIIDYSAISIAAIVIAVKTQGADATESYCKHMILNSIRGYNHKWKNEYGKIHICCDAGRPWRKNVFKEYKGKRQKTRDDSSIDWDMVYRVMDEMKEVLRDVFGYHVHDIEGCEADDIIGVLAHRATKTEEWSLIVSNDKDFFQTHSNYVSQYRPSMKKIFRHPDPVLYLREHIIRGDSGDGVPNIFSPDDAIMDDNQRQNKCTAKKMEHWLAVDLYGVEEAPRISAEKKEEIRRVWRNINMIDLKRLPPNIFDVIYEGLEKSSPTGNQKTIMAWLGANRMRILLGKVNEFIN